MNKYNKLTNRIIMSSNIKNYTTQTNYHRGYTIEELRRLFGPNKDITSSENLIQLINQCFNFELVSGTGIKIVELKNNEFKNNTTKTYRIECTVEGGGGSGGGSGCGCDIDTDKGVTFDVDGSTIIANLYDYDETGDPETDENIYPVSLSKDGKLIVSLIKEASLDVNSAASYNIHKFVNSDIEDNFTHTITITGSGISVYQIDTWVEENGTVTNLKTYGRAHEYISYLNTNKSIEIYEDCDGRIISDEPDSSVVREGFIQVYYTYKGENLSKSDSAKTSFVHPIYFGWTCGYVSSADSPEKHPSRYALSRIQPCFKVYAQANGTYLETTYYNNEGKRIGIKVINNNGNEDVQITNSENLNLYIIGYYYNDQSDEGKHTSQLVVNSSNFDISFGEKEEGVAGFMVILLPSSFGEFKTISGSVNGSMAFPYLTETNSTMIKENIILSNTFYNENESLELNYTAYTSASENATDIHSVMLTCETTSN